MKTYNPINAILFFIACIVLVILLTLEFDSNLYTVLQDLIIVGCLLVTRLTFYDFKQFYNEEIKEK